MEKVLLPFKVILLSLKPLSKTADAWDLRDIANIFINAGGWGGSWLMLENFEWFNPYHLLIFPIVLLFIAALKLQNQKDGYESQTPRIVFQQGGVADTAIFKQNQFIPEGQEIDTREPLGLNVNIVYVFVKNDPQGSYRGEQRTAKRAVAAIEIYKPDDLSKPILSFWGRWRGNIQVIRLEKDKPIEHLAPFDLPPNGFPHRIEFALKYLEDNDMYGYNDETQRYSKDGRYKDLKLPPNEFFAKIRLKAIGLDSEPLSWYKVDHGGAKTKPVIVQLSEKEMKILKKSALDKGGSPT